MVCPRSSPNANGTVAPQTGQVPRARQHPPAPPTASGVSLAVGCWNRPILAAPPVPYGSQGVGIHTSCVMRWGCRRGLAVVGQLGSMSL